MPDDILREQLQTTLGTAYTIERELGGGGMSRVFVAHEQALGRDVVVKVLTPELVAGVSVERFAREIRLAASLQEPHIVPVLTAGVTTDELPYYTMPYVRGESLRARMRAGTVPLAEAMALLRNVAEALAYAHAQGVVHRDIKPENVLLSSRTAVVTDFGIAKALQRARTLAPGDGTFPAETLTRLGTSIGTPAYMAPEQAAGDPATDHRADLYAWGVMAYELLAGRHPFAGKTTPHALMAAHFSEVPEPLPTQVPRQLAALVMRCIEKDPAKRPASANELLDALDAVPSRGDETRSRNRTGLFAGAAVVVAIAIVATAFVARRLPSSATSTSPAIDRSVAVLPLDNASRDTATAYFAAGLTEELASAVAKVSGLRVIGGTSAAIAKGQAPTDAHAIGEKLHVAQVLDGSVRRAGPRVRITARLTSAADRSVTWTETYERDAADVFAVQAEIAQAVAQALRIRLAGADSARLASGGTRDTLAHELFLRGRAVHYQYGEQNIRRAIKLYEQATDRDPHYAGAWSAIADAWFNLADEYVAPREAAPHILEATQQALAIDPTFTLAHVMRINGLMMAGRLSVRDAANQARADAAASPNTQGFASLIIVAVDTAAGAELAARSVALDPLSGINVWTQAIIERYAGRLADAERHARRAVSLLPDVGYAHGSLGEVLLDEGRTAEALAEFERGVALGDRDFSIAHAGVALARLGRRDEARQRLTTLEAAARTRYVIGDWVAKLRLALGDRAGALSWLERAADAGSGYTRFIDVDPDYAPLRGDPRFEALRRRIGL